MPRLFTAAGTCVGIALLAALLYRMSALKPLDHDEHQFIASGALLAREGLLPYRDAPYHHLPYLSFVYAFVFRWCDDLLAGARGFSVACATALAVMLAVATNAILRDHDGRIRHAAAVATVLVLIANPLFVYTSGRAWNHDLAVFLTIAATLVHLGWLERSMGARSALATGLLLGAAIGTRSSFALTIPAFLVSFGFLGSRDPRARIRAITAFGVGGVVALLPVALLFIAAPDRFLFGNLEYNLHLNTEYREAMGWAVAMTPSQKLSFVYDEIVSHRRNWWLCAFLATAILSLGAGRWSPRHRSSIAFVLLLLATLTLGAWAPTPSWQQYFYALVPAMILAAVLALDDFASMRARWIPAVCGLCLMATTLAGLRHYQAAITAYPDESQPALASEIGEQIADLTAPGRILTLAPLYALQAGRDVYTWLATGPFSWRTAPLVDEDRRAALGIAGPDELTTAVAIDPPVAVLLGAEQDSVEALEQPISAWLHSRTGLVRHTLPGGFELWVRSGH